jgi:hypothetical protein
MILLYTLLLVFLAVLVWIVGRRAASLERRYLAKAQAIQRVLCTPVYKPGNSNKPDACRTSLQHYRLGQLADERDALEGRYLAWQGRAERLRAWLGRVRAWKGQKLPYTMGALDVSLVLLLIDHLGVGQVLSARALVQAVLAWFSG